MIPDGCPHRTLVEYEGCPETCEFYELTPCGGDCLLVLTGSEILFDLFEEALDDPAANDPDWGSEEYMDYCP